MMTGEEQRSMAANAFTKWKVKDAKAQKLIVSIIKKKSLLHILNSQTAYEMFRKLCSIYERDMKQQKCFLMREFFNYKYDKNVDISTNISQLENLAMKLKALRKDQMDPH